MQNPFYFSNKNFSTLRTSRRIFTKPWSEKPDGYYFLPSVTQSTYFKRTPKLWIRFAIKEKLFHHQRLLCSAIFSPKRRKSCKIGNFIYYSKGDNHFKNCIKSTQDVISCDSIFENSRKKMGKAQVVFQHNQRLLEQWWWDELEIQKRRCDSISEGWGLLPVSCT